MNEKLMAVLIGLLTFFVLYSFMNNVYLNEAENIPQKQIGENDIKILINSQNIKSQIVSNITLLKQPEFYLDGTKTIFNQTLINISYSQNVSNNDLINWSKIDLKSKFEKSDVLILLPQKILCFDSNGFEYISENTSSVLFDDELYMRVSGDCMMRGRGIILSGFTNPNLPDLNKNNMNLTFRMKLIVEYKTHEYTRVNESIEWSTNITFQNTTIKPIGTTSDIKETSDFFIHNFTIKDLGNLKIRYNNPNGGINPNPVYFDYIWVVLHIESEFNIK
jgi:hypothetical protein